MPVPPRTEVHQPGMGIITSQRPSLTSTLTLTLTRTLTLVHTLTQSLTATTRPDKSRPALSESK